MVSIVDVVTRAEEVAVTTLAQPAHAAATTLTVLHAGSLAPPPNVVQIGAEYIRYDGIAGNTLTGCTRGVKLGGAGAPPGDHAHGAGVAQGATILNHVWPGVMWPYAGAIAPPGWLPCDGAAVSRTTYAALFAAIGVTFGPGDGSTTFTLPDTRGRVLLGASATYPLGSTGGAATVTLTAAQSGLPAHTHTHTDYTFGTNTNTCATCGASRLVNVTETAGGDTTGSAGGTGAGAAHENLPPYLAATAIIKV